MNTHKARYFCSGFCPDYQAVALLFWKISVCILVAEAIQTLPKSPVRMVSRVPLGSSINYVVQVMVHFLVTEC